MTQPIGSIPSKLVPQAATRCAPINVLGPCQNIHSIPCLYMHHKCSRENGGAAPSCLRHPAAVCLFAVRGEVASYSPPRFGLKHHQVTNGVRVWIHSDCAHSTFSLKEEGASSGLCPSYRSFLGSHNPRAQQCNTQDFYQRAAE